jgi:uncharacterized membrane protein
MKSVFSPILEAKRVAESEARLLMVVAFLLLKTFVSIYCKMDELISILPIEFLTNM